MSSMFKKKGGLAFKPKIPATRTRSSANSTAQETAKAPERQEIVAPSSSAAAKPTTATDQPEPNIPKTAETQDPVGTRPGSAIGKSTGTPNTTSITTSGSPAPLPQETSVSLGSHSTRAATRSTKAPAELGSRRVNLRNAPSDDQANRASAAPGKSAELPATTASVGDTLTDRAGGSEGRQEALPAPEVQQHKASTGRSGPAPGRPARKASASKPTARAPKPTSQQPEVETAVVEVVTDVGPTVQPRGKKRSRKAGQPSQETAPTPDSEKNEPRLKRQRSVTPEDAEGQVVDLQKLKMSDLTKDLHIGKKFSRHDELRDRERQSRIKARLAKRGLEANGDDESADNTSEDRSVPPKSGTPSETPMPPAAPASGPQFRIVDGQIVVDQNSLVMDRHARAAAANAGEDLETIEENDFTRLITSNSFMNTSKLRGPNIWTAAETELFYHGLRMFGTDFEMISKMVPGKQRRHIKLKYNREERHCPDRVRAAAFGEKTVPMDMEEYKAATGSEFESIESIEAEQRKIQEGFEAERQRIADEQAEIMRKKREELFADEDGKDSAAAALGTGVTKKGGKKKAGSDGGAFSATS